MIIKKLVTRTVIIIVTYALLKEIFSAGGIIKNLALTTALNFTLATLVVILLSPVIVSSSGFLFFRKFNKPTNFKVGVWRLRTSNKYESDKALVKIKRKLTVKEFETFEVLAKTFEGTIEELIIVVKEIESK